MNCMIFSLVGRCTLAIAEEKHHKTTDAIGLPVGTNVRLVLSAELIDLQGPSL